MKTNIVTRDEAYCNKIKFTLTKYDTVTVIGNLRYCVELTVHAMDERFRSNSNGDNSFNTPTCCVFSGIYPSLDRKSIGLWGTDKTKDIEMCGYAFDHPWERDNYFSKVYTTLLEWARDWEGWNETKYTLECKIPPLKVQNTEVKDKPEKWKMGIGYDVEKVVNKNLKLSEEIEELKIEKQKLLNQLEKLKKYGIPQTGKLNIY